MARRPAFINLKTSDECFVLVGPQHRLFQDICSTRAGSSALGSARSTTLQTLLNDSGFAAKRDAIRVFEQARDGAEDAASISPDERRIRENGALDTEVMELNEDRVHELAKIGLICVKNIGAIAGSLELDAKLQLMVNADEKWDSRTKQLEALANHNILRYSVDWRKFCDTKMMINGTDTNAAMLNFLGKNFAPLLGQPGEDFILSYCPAIVAEREKAAGQAAAVAAANAAQDQATLIQTMMATMSRLAGTVERIQKKLPPSPDDADKKSGQRGAPNPPGFGPARGGKPKPPPGGSSAAAAGAS